MLLLQMSPYILFGLFIAGVLHVLIPQEKIYSHLSKNNFTSILKASLFGVPLPLCSCGVIPVAAHLRREGAAKGPTLSFLISTPTSGIDSILATYSLLGPLFAVIRPLASLVGGIMAGLLSAFSDKEAKPLSSMDFACTVCDITIPHLHSVTEKIERIFQYAFTDLLDDIAQWLMIGVAIGGIIAYLAPPALIERYLGNPLLAYPLMLLIGTPMYVCATGSIPIAASLILKGMTPGAGLLFLIAGPATNTATLSFVGGKLGKKALFIYIFTLFITALVFSFVIDLLWRFSGKNIILIAPGLKLFPLWLKSASAVILLALIGRVLLLKKR